MADNDSKIIENNDLQIRNKIHKYAQGLMAFAKDIGIGTINNTFVVDLQRTEKLLVESYENIISDGTEVTVEQIDQIKDYTKNVFLQIKQFINNIKNTVKNPNSLNTYISSICGFVALRWYKDIVQFEIGRFNEKFNRFKQYYTRLYKNYVDLETKIKLSIFNTSFSWLANSRNSNLTDIRQKMYKTYTNGIKEAEDKQIAIDKIYKFLNLIQKIEQFFDKNHYKQSKVNLLVSKEYSDLRDTVSKGLEFFSFIDVDKSRSQFEDLKKALFEKVKIKDLHDEYDENVVYDSSSIEKINKTKLGLDEQIINNFYLFGAYQYFKNENGEDDLIPELNKRIYSQYNSISVIQANKILQQLINISRISNDSLHMNVSNESIDKLEEFNKQIFTRARELALSLDSKLSPNSILYNITTLDDLNKAINNTKSELLKKRNNVVQDVYQDIYQDEEPVEFSNTVTDSSFNNILSVIKSRNLDNFFELSGDDTLTNVLKELKNIIDTYNNAAERRNKNKGKNDKSITLIKMPIIHLQKMVVDLCSLQSAASTIAINTQKWREVHDNRRPPDYIRGYRKLVGEFILALKREYSRGQKSDINNAIKK